MSDFMECDTCRALPGTPRLCAGCFHNREIIAQLSKRVIIDAGSTEDSLKRIADYMYQEMQARTDERAKREQQRQEHLSSLLHLNSTYGKMASGPYSEPRRKWWKPFKFSNHKC